MLKLKKIIILLKEKSHSTNQDFYISRLNKLILIFTITQIKLISFVKSISKLGIEHHIQQKEKQCLY